VTTLQHAARSKAEQHTLRLKNKHALKPSSTP